MDNKALQIIVTGVTAWLLRELWEWNKSGHSKIESNMEAMRSELSEMKTILLLTQSKYDLFNDRLDSLVRIKESFGKFNDRIEKLEQQREI